MTNVTSVTTVANVIYRDDTPSVGGIMTSQASSSDNGSRLRWLVLGLGAVTLSLAACTGAVSGGGEATATATTTPAVPTVAPVSYTHLRAHETS